MERQPSVPWGLKDLLVVLTVLVLAGQVYAQWGRTLIEKGWGWISSLPPSELIYFLSGGLVQSLLIILLVIFLVKVRHRAGLSTLGLSYGHSSPARVLWEGIAGGILLMLGVAALALIIYILLRQPFQPQPFAEVVVQAQNWKQLAALMLIGSLMAPLSEELYFRGMFFGYLRQHLGAWPAIWLSGTIFAGMHLDLARFIPLLFGGAGLAYLYHRTGSLYASVLAHAVWNTAMTLLIWYTGGAAGL